MRPLRFRRRRNAGQVEIATLEYIAWRTCVVDQLSDHIL